MQLLSLALIASLIAKSIAHSYEDTKLEDSDLSLPELSHFDHLNFPTWKVGHDAAFKAGRLILTPRPMTKGSILASLPIDYKDFTIEIVFRALGFYGETHSGLSLRYVKEHQFSDHSFFGGPAKWDGLNVIVDSDSSIGSSIHAFFNDGTIDYSKFSSKELYEQAFASCLISYQDSQVPTTLRIGHYDGTSVIQVNNRLCMKSKKIKLPQNYKVGLSAVTGEDYEQFELLRLKTYGGVISEIIANDNKAAPHVNVVKKYVGVDKDGNKRDLNEKDVEKLKHQDKKAQPQKAQPQLSQQVPVKKSNDGDDSKLSSQLQQFFEKVQATNQELLSKVASLDAKVNIVNSINKDGQNKDGELNFSFLEEYTTQLNKLNTNIDQIQKTIKNLGDRYQNLEKNLVIDKNSIISRIQRLNDENIDQLRENEVSIEELKKNVDYLILSEKDRQQLPIHDLVAGLKYLIFPILIVTAALSFFTYRLRGEIKAKLL